MLKQRLNVVRVQLVKEQSIQWEHEERFTCSSQVADAIRIFLDGTDRENFVVLNLDNKNRITSITSISVGTLNQSIVHPREVFKPAILANSAAIILAHNHPSGDPTPSYEDKTVTKRMQEAGEVLGIKVLDHIIIGDNTTAYFSFVENCEL